MQYIVSQGAELKTTPDDTTEILNKVKRDVNSPFITEEKASSLLKYNHKNIRNFLNIEYENNIDQDQIENSSNSLNLIKFDEPLTSFDLRRLRNKEQRYNLKNSSLVYSSQIMQDQILLQILDSPYLKQHNASKNGIFVEAGAYDGETWSNTLHLERFKNWTGLLIEPSAENYQKLRDKNRNSFSLNSCIYAGSGSINSSYIEAGPFGIMTNSSGGSSVICHSFENILKEFFTRYFPEKRSLISRSVKDKKFVVDYMSLDIEGYERSTIKAFPWDKFQINLLNIEYNQNIKSYKWIKNYLRRYGYYETVVDDVWYQDLYLAHKSVVGKLNLNVEKVSEFIKINKKEL